MRNMFYTLVASLGLLFGFESTSQACDDACDPVLSFNSTRVSTPFGFTFLRTNRSFTSFGFVPQNTVVIERNVVGVSAPVVEKRTLRVGRFGRVVEREVIRR